MPNRSIKTEKDLGNWCETLRRQPLPLTVSFTLGVKRTNPQNKTIHMWYGQAASLLGDVTTDEVRAQCKLQMGVPILRNDDSAFRLMYDATFKPLPYEDKLNLFTLLDPAITSRMTVAQLTKYMDEMQKHFLPMGIHLTDPAARKYEAMQ